jgi:ribose transport system ATP-binding protein
MNATIQRRTVVVRRFLKGDYSPSAILSVVIVLLALYTWSQNSRVLTAYNISSTLTLVTATAFASYGQLMVILTGGIDLSVGPLMGLTVVIASFYINDGRAPTTVLLGFVLMAVAAVGTGIINGGLVRVGRFNPVAATLITYIGLQGISLELRPFQGGYINADVVNFIGTSVGTIPVAFLVAVGLALVLEYCLRNTTWGRNLRAAGSQEVAAQRLGVRVNWVIFSAYILCSALTLLGGVMLMAQLGVGDPTQGVTYTLGSVAAVVLGGASLFGGRGSFIGALLGALLIEQILDATTFLNLSEQWQYWFQGIFLLIAAAIYTRARSTGRHRFRRRGGLASATEET